MGPETLWVLLMLLTTLVPVCAYVISVILFPFSKFVYSSENREILAQGLSDLDPKSDLGPCYRATFYLCTRVLIGVAILGLLVIGAFFSFSGLFKFAGSTLLDYSKWIIVLTESFSVHPMK